MAEGNPNRMKSHLMRAPLTALWPFEGPLFKRGKQ
jgi:hypothetical protein